MLSWDSVELVNVELVGLVNVELGRCRSRAGLTLDRTGPKDALVPTSPEMV